MKGVMIEIYSYALVITWERDYSIYLGLGVLVLCTTGGCQLTCTPPTVMHACDIQWIIASGGQLLTNI